ncbi:hypothetical protein GpartN1_g4643.t1 [Galdieria partita]|uniref:Endoplasmic reticulum transmembrane protein n=1 Tax=Galdieria partita TaxID=83374 RepID=A0A9C7Q0G2_9RHOD|nr:hypothetical protein GpartN1_g4643.t1 [Galdieria partita]
MKNMLWLLVYLFLCTEIAIVALLVLPLPKRVRRLVLRLLATGSQFLHLAKFINYISLSLFFGMIESLTDAYRVQLKLSEQTAANGLLSNAVSFEVHTLKQRQFRSQRNFYLASFSLTLLFVISKLFELTSRINVLESQLETKFTSGTSSEQPSDLGPTSSNQDQHSKKTPDKAKSKELKSFKPTTESKKIV